MISIAKHIKGSRDAEKNIWRKFQKEDRTKRATYLLEIRRGQHGARFLEIARHEKMATGTNACASDATDHISYTGVQPCADYTNITRQRRKCVKVVQLNNCRHFSFHVLRWGLEITFTFALKICVKDVDSINQSINKCLFKSNENKK